MAVVLRMLAKQYQLLAHDYSDERLPSEWPLTGNPTTIAAILVFYLWFVLKGGPNFMKNREPFKLDRIIQIYNIAQVLICGYLTIQGIGLYKPFGWLNLACRDFTLEDTPQFRKMHYLGYIYFLVKVVDLIDTVFFVLRKKQSQITFLHVYHHTFMVLGTFTFCKYFPAEQCAFLCTINCLVHTVMYAYYFLASYSSKYRKNIWWKKYLTQLQIFQFGSIFLHAMNALIDHDCNFPRSILYLMIPQNLFIALMFLDFYKKSYLRENRGTVSKSE